METNPQETTATDANSNSVPTCFVCKKPLPDNQWFCRLTPKVTEISGTSAEKILLCSPACASRHFSTAEPEQS